MFWLVKSVNFEYLEPIFKPPSAFIIRDLRRFSDKFLGTHGAEWGGPLYASRLIKAGSGQVQSEALEEKRIVATLQNTTFPLRNERDCLDYVLREFPFPLALTYARLHEEMDLQEGIAAAW